MRITTVDKELIRYFTQLNEPQKKSLLALIKNFLVSSSNNKFLSGTTIEQYNKELEMAEEEFMRGEYITHQEMQKRVKQW